MIWRIHRDQIASKAGADYSHHSHGYGEEMRRINTGHGTIAELAIKEDGVPPRFWLAFERGRKIADIKGQECTIETIRPDGRRQCFAMVNKGIYLESVETIPEPHNFIARLAWADGHYFRS